MCFSNRECLLVYFLPGCMALAFVMSVLKFVHETLKPCCSLTLVQCARRFSPCSADVSVRVFLCLNLCSQLSAVVLKRKPAFVCSNNQYDTDATTFSPVGRLFQVFLNFSRRQTRIRALTSVGCRSSTPWR